MSGAALAAGADWVNCEGTLAAVQSGWITVARMRSIKLLGARAPGARESFAIMLGLSSGLVALLNVPLLTPTGAGALSRLMSNDDAVAKTFSQLLWVLCVHSQTRIVDLTCASMLVPMGWPKLRVGVSVVTFWMVATPIAAVGALTDAFTSSMLVKVQLCVGCTSIGQLLNALCYGAILLRIDWDAASKVIDSRANTDRSATTTSPQEAPVSDASPQPEPWPS